MARKKNPDKGPSSDSTIPFEQILRSGNELFSRAVGALGGANSLILRDTLKAMGSGPDRLTADELGVALPEIERRVRMLMQPQAASDCMARLRHVLLTWEP
ncbi:MAG TPA: hypothetical protein VL172_11065 [Kofleriaceae bacterium]|nr:hypothetical protein [Kofleriaceae bacterium]